MIQRARKKPVEVDVVQFLGHNASLIEKFVGDKLAALKRETDGNAKVIGLTVSTLEGDMRAGINDWIIKGVNGEFYPCKPDIFDKTYEIVGTNIKSVRDELSQDHFTSNPSNQK